MRKSLLLAMTLSLLLSGTAMVFGATAKKAVKAVPKKTAASSTVQLAGNNGVFGTVYSIVKSSPIYFRLKSAEFTTGQVIVGETLYAPGADEKLLVLHFTLQNPQKSEQPIRSDTLKFTVVDAVNTNHEGDERWGDERNHSEVDMSLKPAQTIDIYTCITVPSKGTIPKLMVMPPSDNNGPILRYDLTSPKNKVTALKAPFADPSDSSGYTALGVVQGKLNVLYPYYDFDFAVEKFEYTTDKLDKDEAPEDGTRYLVVTLLAKNKSPQNTLLRCDTIIPVLTTTDGDELEYQEMLLASANRPFNKDVRMGEENRVRIYFTLPERVTPKTLAIKEGESGRIYEFKVQ